MAPDVPWRNANGRSLDYPPGEVVDVHRNRPLRVWRAGGAVHEFRQLHVPNRQIRQLDQLCCRAPRLSADRKSTRLNSSHGYISYAVFCLKKKKKEKTKT